MRSRRGLGGWFPSDCTAMVAGHQHSHTFPSRHAAGSTHCRCGGRCGGSCKGTQVRSSCSLGRCGGWRSSQPVGDGCIAIVGGGGGTYGRRHSNGSRGATVRRLATKLTTLVMIWSADATLAALGKTTVFRWACMATVDFTETRCFPQHMFPGYQHIVCSESH